MLIEKVLLTDDEEAEIGLCVRRECHREGINEYDTQKQVIRAVREAQVAKAINFFKAEVDKLTVIDDDEILKASSPYADDQDDLQVVQFDREIAKAQLQNTKKHLYDLVEE